MLSNVHCHHRHVPQRTHPSPLLVVLGKRIQEIRRDKGLTQEQLAAASGLHRAYIGHLEAGRRNPTILTISLLAEGLNVPMAELVSFPQPVRAQKDRMRPPSH